MYFFPRYVCSRAVIASRLFAEFLQSALAAPLAPDSSGVQGISNARISAPISVFRFAHRVVSRFAYRLTCLPMWPTLLAVFL